jgi:hypothetical protein
MADYQRYAKSDLEVAQRACVTAGMNRMASWTDADSTEAGVLSEMYEDLARDALSATRWNFAMQQVVLTGFLAAPPYVLWDMAMQIPQDISIVEIKTLWINGESARYAWVGQTVQLDALTTDQVVMDYIARVPELYWPPYFTFYMILHTAAFMAGAIARNGTLGEELESRAERQLAVARARDAQQQTNKIVPYRRIISTRRGGMSRNL